MGGGGHGDDETRGTGLLSRRCVDSRVGEGVYNRGLARTGASQRIPCGAPVAQRAKDKLQQLLLRLIMDDQLGRGKNCERAL